MLSSDMCVVLRIFLFVLLLSLGRKALASAVYTAHNILYDERYSVPRYPKATLLYSRRHSEKENCAIRVQVCQTLIKGTM
jgi:hypothetical protein